ncbi:MAG TPA: phosphate ABC transporter permease PtsA [Gammaproteobacteria bacterium]|jgi:phosphate transport system permease protein|nr:phosphate ABC transporter permease PtsA [Gammaproteobacteria bacterium]
MNTQAQRLKKRHQISAAFKLFCLSVTCLAVALLGILILEVTLLGLPWLNFDFLTRFPSRFPEKAGILAGLAGTLWLVTLTAAIAIPIGVLAAVYLEEYAKPGRVSTFITINIANLAGVPSIVYGIIGLAIFVRFFGLDRSVLAGAMTMSLLILPVIIIASREAIKAVPSSLRQVAFALGATRWQVTRDHVLPQAMPGILTGVILALSRAIGETAPLIIIGALTYIAFVPEGPMDEFTALPIQIYNWTSRPQEAFHELASAGIIVLLLVLLIMNATAVWIRYRGSKNKFM